MLSTLGLDPVLFSALYWPVAVLASISLVSTPARCAAGGPALGRLLWIVSEYSYVNSQVFVGFARKFGDFGHCA